MSIRSLRNTIRRNVLFRKYSTIPTLNKPYTLISSDCIGGVVYHDLNHSFDSPTINMAISASDFVKLCSNLKYYFSVDFVENVTKTVEFGYPVANIDDIELRLIHYSSFDYAKQCWLRRIKRINYNNIFFIMTDRNHCSDQDILNFEKLPYQNKICFVSRIRGTNSQNVQFLVPDSIEKNEVDVMVGWTSILHRRIDCFDFPRWIYQGIQ